MDLFTSHQLLLAVHEAGIRRDNFFKRVFFRERYTFTTKKVDLDMIPNRTKIAAYCSPMIGAVVDRQQGYSASSFLPAYVKSKHAVDPSMTVMRLPGESYAKPKSPSERQNALVMQNLEQEEDAISQREELMCAEMVLTGKTIIDGPYVEEAFEIDAGRRPENNIVLSGAAKWDVADPDTYNPCADIDEWASKADGLIDIIAMDKQAWAKINKFKKFNDKLETRRGSASHLETALKDLGSAVSIKGVLGDVVIVVIDEEFIDRKGKTQKIMPANTLVMGHTGARGACLYGSIQDLNAQQEGLDEAERYCRDWVEGNDPAVRYTKTESAPAMFLVDVNHFVVVKVA
ncbi:major capsid protein [Photobacterium leiognathi]|uniref:major capsid protein n=1 Tax=Photobacterium leiognathi TaxID=553611 RepID=UPI00020880C9|nr:major capsid protein [Photobacterium leiognathi]GAA03225.1 phage major capsid E family protein [Photobacterium leiognathi subsp. mandapamensis svers.1.1.]